MKKILRHGWVVNGRIQCLLFTIIVEPNDRGAKDVLEVNFRKSYGQDGEGKICQK